ncbi:RidA family protein [Rhodococcus sp. ARC_M6]|uniref:RidA family protein n=1 Tax=Rhodococcus sp. ARC_M6 TaxID=2928852 RepID=UPI001FB43E55|nr:RidA family protein [Rhodococcus sp. ARC_M6]MCJ0904045.1 RidA family protein [Rhodococcus sp. ARC_M6]
MTSSAQHPYSPAVTAGGLAFVSGALSIDSEGIAVAGRMPALDAAIDRMCERLATVGGELSDVVKLTYFVTDVTLRDEANQQFERLFTEPRPARTFLEVSNLPYGATVEIDAVARQRP